MKRIVALLLAGALLLTACNSSTSSSTSSAEESSATRSEPSTEQSYRKEEPEGELSVEEAVPEEPSTPEEPEESEESQEPVESSIALAPPQRSLTSVTVTPEQILERLTRSIEELEALDNTAITWGPGTTSGEVRPTAPIQLQEKYGQYGAWFIAPNNGNIYLTFDEGYEAGYNDGILDTLKEKNVSAVFFVTLGFVQSRPDLIQRMIDEGHTIGNHTWKHIPFPDMEVLAAATDVMTLHQFMLENYHYEMTLCRPPAGAFSVRSLQLLEALGYESIFWSFAYRDWILEEQPTPADGKATILGRSHPGAIYLLHAVSQTNAEILADSIDALRNKGYEFSAWDIEGLS